MTLDTAVRCDPRLIVALDLPTVEEARAVVDGLDDAVSFYGADETRTALAAAKTGDAAQRRDRMGEHFSKLPPNPTHADVIAMNRVANAPAL